MDAVRPTHFSDERSATHLGGGIIRTHNTSVKLRSTRSTVIARKTALVDTSGTTVKVERAFVGSNASLTGSVA